MYSSVLGRFMQTDPVGYADQINLYAYAGNDPMNMTDPTGLSEVAMFPSGSGLEYISSQENSIWFDIFTHGGNMGAVDERSGISYLSPEALHSYARDSGYHDGQTTFLLSCNLGRAYPDQKAFNNYPYQNSSFAQQYANVTKGNVVANSGLVTWKLGPGVSSGRRDTVGTQRKGDSGSFRLYIPGQKASLYLGDKVVISGKDGSVTFYKKGAGPDGTDLVTLSCNSRGNCKS